jgi:NADH:ubiquinone oxidoreductase subunit 4 (subunit M)
VAPSAEVGRLEDPAQQRDRGRDALDAELVERSQHSPARSLAVLAGVAPRMPRLAWALILGGLAVLGVPGFGSFVSELLTLMGSVRNQPVGALGAAGGLALAAIAVAVLLYRVLFRRPLPNAPGVSDSVLHESWFLGVLAGTLLWIGIVPSGPKLAGIPIFDPGIVNVTNAGASQLASPYVPGGTATTPTVPGVTGP